MAAISICVTFLVASGAQPLTGQASGGTVCSFRGDPIGQLQGRLDGHNSQAPAAHRPVSLERRETGERCEGAADAVGNFTFRGLPLGGYTMRVATGGGRGALAETFEVTGATAVVRETVLLPWLDATVVCLARPRCAPLLAPASSPVGPADDDDALRRFAYRLSLAIARVDGDWGVDGGLDVDADWVACVEGTEVDRESLRERYPTVVPEEECANEREAPPGARRPLFRRHPPSGRLARLILAPQLDRLTPTRVRVSTEYYAGPLWGAAHVCEVEWTEQGWVARGCGRIGEA